MTEPESPIDLSEPEDKNGFPWLVIIGIVVVSVALGFWIMKGRARTDSAIAVLEQQRAAQKVVLDLERDKVLTMTNQLDVLKRQIAAGQTKDKAAAVKRYNDLAAEQRAQREKVKTLADQYNQIITKLHELQ